MVRQGAPEFTEGLTMILRQAQDGRILLLPGTAKPYHAYGLLEQLVGRHNPSTGSWRSVVIALPADIRQERQSLILAYDPDPRTQNPEPVLSVM